MQLIPLRHVRTFAAFFGLVCVLWLSACGGDPTPAENRAPVAAIQFTPPQANAPVSVQFSGATSNDSDGRIVSYIWDFGDGSQGSGVSQSHVYASAGRYSVTLTVTDDVGASHTESTNVTIAGNRAPVAVILTSAQRGEVPFNVEFRGDSSYDLDGRVVSYLWNFGQGATATDPVVQRTYNQPGDYNVSLTITDSGGLTATQNLTVTALATTASFSIGGVISSLPHTDVDGDVNDPFAPYFDNNGHTPANVQPIANPVLLNGYATYSQTGRAQDTFGFEADQHDIYSVNLLAGDYVSMQVVDFNSGDLDLFLIDGNTSDVVAMSEGTGEFESLQVPRPGHYFVMINAASRASRYLLRVGRTSFVSGPAASGQSADFAPDQAVLKRRESLTLGMGTVERAQLRLSHQQTKRVALAHLNPVNPQTQSMLNLSAVPVGFESWLGQRNPDAAGKLRTLKAIKKLRQQPDIDFAEPNYRVRTLLTPTDPAYVFQWHYPAISLPQAWNITTGSADVRVAVIDTGVYLAHPDLQGQLVDGYDFVSSPSTSNDGDGLDPDPSDPGDSIHVGSSSWHGTHVTGTLVAHMNNREGGTGVAPGVRVMPIRALGRGGGLAYDVLQAVRYAAGMENDSGVLPERSADIINQSLGGAGYSQYAQDLYNSVRAKGILLIASAGNENTDEPMYPASYAGVVSVAATDVRGARAPYSNRGTFVDVAAPGGVMSEDRNNDGYSDGILSTSVAESESGLEKSYVYYQGTSMAAPHVAGIAALMKSVHPQMTPEEFESLLVSGAITQDKGAVGRDNDYGYGLINAYSAVEAARALAQGGTTSAVIADTNLVVFDQDLSEQELQLRALGSGAIRVTGSSVTESWLSVRPVNVNAQGLGTYRIAVARGNLPDGVYRGFVEFTTDQGATVRVQVNMRVGEFVAVGNAGYLYVLLIDAELGSTLGVVESAPVEGQYTYRFDNVPLGDYYLAAGSDINNDGLVCETGESCGFYPSIGDLVELRVDANKTNLNFPAGLHTGLDLTNSSQRREGLSRVLFEY
jgi:serine protease